MNPRSYFSSLAQRFLCLAARDFFAGALLTGAVLRLYVRVGFLVRVGAPKDGVDGAVYVTGAGAGWTVSYMAGAGAGSGAGDGAGATTTGASGASACSVVGT